MPLEYDVEAAQGSRKRSYDSAFSQPQTIIDTIFPRISGLVSSAVCICQKALVHAAQYVSAKALVWQDSQTQVIAGTRKGRRRRRRHREGETAEERQHRQQVRRQGRARPSSGSRPKAAGVKDWAAATRNFAEQPVISTSEEVSPTIPQSTSDAPRRKRDHVQAGSTILKYRYQKALESRRRLGSLIVPTPSRSTIASPMHVQLLNNVHLRQSPLATRTSRDVLNVLNRITPHKSRVQKGKPQIAVDHRSLPFTRNLAAFLESPAQSSPFLTYRSPGAAPSSPAPSFNPFKTKPNGKRITAHSEAESLEDLIAQLRKEHPHQYEWKKIDAERAERDAVIERKRLATTRSSRLPIPMETVKTVEKALHGHLPNDHILVEKFNQEIRVKDLCTLRNTEWLNDEVINFYMNLIVERSRGKDCSYPRIFAFNTFFYTKLSSGGYNDVRRWAKKAKVNIASCELVLIPVHLGVHWCMAIINAREKRFEYWDSLKGGAGKVFISLRDYMRNECPSIPLTEWQDWTPSHGPQQRNGYDCGVFACQTAESISRLIVPDFSQNEMQELRKRMAASIMDLKIY